MVARRRHYLSWLVMSTSSRTRAVFPRRTSVGVFVGAGLENVSFELFTSAKRQGRAVHFFLGTGTKPAEVAAVA